MIDEELLGRYGFIPSARWSASSLDAARKWKRQRLRERLAKTERGEELTDDSDEEFDEGFKVPGFLWKKLFKYVQYSTSALIHRVLKASWSCPTVAKVQMF